MSERSALENAARIAAAARVAVAWKLGIPIAIVALLLGSLIMLPVIVVSSITSGNPATGRRRAAPAARPSRARRRPSPDTPGSSSRTPPRSSTPATRSASPHTA